MLQTVDVGKRSLKASRGVAPEPLIDVLVPLDQPTPSWLRSR